MLKPGVVPSNTFGVRFFKSKSLTDAIARIGPDLYAKTVQELEQLANPSETLQLLKFRYWELIGEGLRSNKAHTIGKLHKGICTYTYLYNDVLSNPVKVAWILSLESNYWNYLEVLKRELVWKIDEIIRLPLQNKDGTVNHSHAKLVVDTMAKLHFLPPPKHF